MSRARAEEVALAAVALPAPVLAEAHEEAAATDAEALAELFEDYDAARLAMSPAAKAYRGIRDEDYGKWDEFSDEEWRLCPPVVAVGGDGAGTHMQNCRQQFSGDFIHIRNHQQQSLRRRERCRQRTCGQCTVYGTGSTAF